MEATKLDFKYDVAVSFLAEDEATAVELSDLLSQRFDVFVYSKRQEHLAGRDGDEAFRQVFLKEARVVVVLYRQKWGKTPFTRIEESAIRDRAHEEGYDFSIFATLEKTSSLPKWLSARKIFFGLLNYGIDGLAGAVERLITVAGGQDRSETLAGRAARAERELKFIEDRKAFLRTEQAVSRANKFFADMTDYVVNRTQEIVSTLQHLLLNAESKRTYTGHPCAVVRGPMRSLSIELHIRFANDLDCSEVVVTVWEGPPDLFGGMFIDRRPAKRSTYRYDIDVDKTMSIRLREDFGRKRLLTGENVADESLNLLIDEVVRAKTFHR